MKRFTLIITALALVLVLAFGAGAETLSGGWSVTEDPSMTEDSAKAFDEAMETLVGATYTPVALLATQVVAGTNYCILCSSELVTATPVKGYALVYIYQPVNGEKSEILDIVDLNGEMIGNLMPAD